jgi:O-antigen biosynthesis protein
MRYPQIVFFRHPSYAPEIDDFIESNKEKWMCTFHIVGEKEGLNKLFDANFPIFVTYGKDYNEYLADVHAVIAPKMVNRWLHFSDLSDIQNINHSVNNCYQSVVVRKHEEVRVIFSLFTTCYNSYEKIKRAYESIKRQTFLDWEWVILDDSPDDAHFTFLRTTFQDDKRVRLYRRSQNSGNIGNVKNEAVSLCRGKYVLEMDHDDEILKDCLKDAAAVFDNQPEIGFIYMNFTNIYEDGSNFSYGDFFGLGYSGYFCEKIMDHNLCGGKIGGKWVNVAMTPNINNITLTHIVAVPNHPRIWRKSTLMELGNYSEYLPICDDYELLIRTATKTEAKLARMGKLGYIQYMNNGNSNFSLMWNAEISRLGPQYIKPHCYSTYRVEERMKEMNASESDTFSHHRSQVWKRNPNYEYKFCNKLVNLDYSKEFCILGIKTLMEHLPRIRELYANPKHDFLVLDYDVSPEELCSILDRLQLDRMKCYAMKDCNRDQLEKYFLFLYKTCEEHEIIG